MPFPSYIPRSDSFGNWYFGGFQVDTSSEVGIGANTNLTATQDQFDAFLDAALGTTNWTRSGNDYYFKFANPWETLTETTTTTSNYRFAVKSQLPGNPVFFNTSISGMSAAQTPHSYEMSDLYDSGHNTFCVANQYGMWICRAYDGSTANVLSTNCSAFYLGWLKDPVFPVNTDDRVRNIICGTGGNSTSTWFQCTQVPNVTTNISACAVNSVLTCEVNTPSANVSDVVVIDTNASNLALGKVHNAVLSTSALTVGSIYRIPPEQDPDSNTEQNLWLCTNNQIRGWNGSTISGESRSILIRVWSNNIV